MEKKYKNIEYNNREIDNQKSIVCIKKSTDKNKKFQITNQVFAIFIFDGSP